MSSGSKLPKQQKSESAPETGVAFSPQKNLFIAGLLLVVATLAFYNPVAHCWVRVFDDIAYVTEDPQVGAGLTWNNRSPDLDQARKNAAGTQLFFGYKAS